MNKWFGVPPSYKCFDNAEILAERSADSTLIVPLKRKTALEIIVVGYRSDEKASTRT